MNYLVTTLIILIAPTCLAMDFSLLKEKRRFMNSIVLGDLHTIDFKKIPQDWLNEGIYIASSANKHDALKQLCEKKADTKSISAQLALINAYLAKNIKAYEILKEHNTPILSYQEALYYAVVDKHSYLVIEILKELQKKPNASNHFIVKIAYIYAKYADDHEDIFDILSEYIPNLSELDELLLVCQYNLHDTLYEMFLQCQFSNEMIVKALEVSIKNQAHETKNDLLEYLVTQKQLFEAISLACKLDLGVVIGSLFDKTQNKLNIALITLRSAKKYDSKSVERAIDLYVHQNNLVARHPRIVAIQKGL